jgi:hypothetical protein
VPLRKHPATLALRPVAGRYTRPRLALKGLTDRTLDRLEGARGPGRALDRAAASAAPLDVLVLGIEGSRSRMAAAVAELRRSRHRVHVVLGTMAEEPSPGLEALTVRAAMRGGKFDNANVLLAGGLAAMPTPRWTVLLDHDVILPPGFLDRFLAVAERCDFALCQPALTLRSFSSHAITRRRPGVLARETRFVEIGPLTAFRAETHGLLLPFPDDAGMGWGLDRHWPAVAAAHGWRLGIVDATPVGHEDAPAASGYSWDAAMEAADAFVRGRPSVETADALRTLRVYRTLW